MFRFNTLGLSATRFKKQSLALLLSATLSVPAAMADDFSEVYKQFQQAVEAGDKEASVSLSYQAWKLGEEKFGKDSENALRLRHSYANMLVDNKEHKQALEEFESLIEGYEELYGEDSKDTFMMYADILGATDKIPANNSVLDFQQSLSRYLLSNAEEIQFDSDKEKANVFHYVASALLKTSISKRYAYKTQQFLQDTMALNTRIWGAGNKNSLELQVLLANVQIARGKSSEAIANLEAVVNELDMNLAYSHPFALVSHAKLVELYESEGESDKATSHCQAIGQMTPWEDNIDPQPIYRTNPSYPMSYARAGKNGSVKLSFTIDTQGFVKDPEIIDVKGGDQFADAALDALKKWRYAPKFEDGKPVNADELYVQIDFKIG